MLYTKRTEVFGIYGPVILVENKALHCRQSKQPDRKPKTSVRLAYMLVIKLLLCKFSNHYPSFGVAAGASSLAFVNVLLAEF